MDKSTQAAQKKEDERINFLRGLEEQDDRGKKQKIRGKILKD